MRLLIWCARKGVQLDERAKDQSRTTLADHVRCDVFGRLYALRIVRLLSRGMAMGHSRDWRRAHRGSKGVDMKDREWFTWWFRYWADRAPYVLDTERSPVDRSDRMDSEGWVP